MLERTVTDVIPEYPNSEVTFFRQGGTFTLDEAFPPVVQTVTTNGSGAYTIDLWPNAEGLTRTHYLAVYPGKDSFSFVLEEGDDPITASELRGQDASEWWPDQGPATIELERARYANNTSDALGSNLIGHLPAGTGAVGTTVQAALRRFAVLNDYIQDGETDVVLAYHRMIAALAPGGVGRVMPGEYDIQSDLIIDKAHTLEADGVTFVVDTSQRVSACASDVTWRGLSTRGIVDTGVERYALFKLKTLGVDPVVNCRRWLFNRCHFRGTALGFTKTGRIGPQSAALSTLTTIPSVAGDTVLHVQSTGGLSAGVYVLAGPQTDPAGQPVNGSYHLSLVDAVNAGGLTLTLHTPLTGALATNRRVAEVTILTQTATAGATVIHVASTALAEEDLYARIALDNGSYHQSVIVDVDPVGLTVTIEGELPSQATSGTWLEVVSAGVQPTSSDFAGDVTLRDCIVEDNRSQYAISFGGIDHGVVSGGVVRNCWAYNVSGTPGSGYNDSYGEGVKVTNGSTGCWIGGGLLIERVHRNAIDLYDAGQTTVDGVTLRNGSPDLVTDLNTYGIYPEAGTSAGALETKRNKTDRNVPEHFQLANIRVERWRGYGVQIGVPLATVTGLQIGYIDGPGLYPNGARPDTIDDSGEPLAPTNDVQIIGPVIHDCSSNGIQVTEVFNLNITGGRVTRCAIGLDLGQYAQQATISGIDLTGNTTDLRVQGIAGSDQRHIISGRWSTTSLSSDATYVLYNGFGDETGLAGGAMPTLAKWPVGATVRNTTDGKIYKRGQNAWYALN